MRSEAKAICPAPPPIEVAAGVCVIDGAGVSVGKDVGVEVGGVVAVGSDVVVSVGEIDSAVGVEVSVVVIPTVSTCG